MKIVFKNKWYPSLLVFLISIVLYVQVLNLIFSFNYVHLVHLILIVMVINAILFFNYDKAEIVIKLWAVIALIGGGLGLISVALLFSIGRLEESVDLIKLIKHFIHILFGFVVFAFWSESVEKP